MRCLSLPARFVVIASGVLALAACDNAPPSSQTQADDATRLACQQRAEAVDKQRNRADIYSPAPQTNTPYSGNYVPDISDRGLSQLYAHDQLVRNCIRNTGTQPVVVPPASPAPPPPK